MVIGFVVHLVLHVILRRMNGFPALLSGNLHTSPFKPLAAFALSVPGAGRNRHKMHQQNLQVHIAGLSRDELAKIVNDLAADPTTKGKVVTAMDLAQVS